MVPGNNTFNNAKNPLQGNVDDQNGNIDDVVNGISKDYQKVKASFEKDNHVIIIAEIDVP